MYSSKSNSSYFMMSVDDIRGSCCWCGSRGWTLPPVFCSLLLLCDRWQQRGTLTQWFLTWKCVWSKGVELNSCTWNKLHSWTFIDDCRIFMKTKQWMWAQWGGGWCFSVVVTVTRKTNHVEDDRSLLSHYKMKSVSTHWHRLANSGVWV